MTDYAVTYTVGRCVGTIGNGTPVVEYGAPIKNRVSASRPGRIVEKIAQHEGVARHRIRVITCTRKD